MATPKYTALAEITLSSTDSSIVFADIPAGYRDLMLVGGLRTDRSATDEPLRIRFNSDSTTGNYSRVSMSGNGSSASSYTDSPAEIIVDAGATAASASSGVFSSFGLQVFDYAQTNKHKSCLTTSDIAAVQTRRQAARWASTAAITSISIVPYFGGNFVSGTTACLYGVK